MLNVVSSVLVEAKLWKKLGILSGIGHLPVDVAHSAKSMGYEVVAIGVVPNIDEELPTSVDFYYDINIGKIGKIISTFKETQSDQGYYDW